MTRRADRAASPAVFRLAVAAGFEAVAARAVEAEVPGSRVVSTESGSLRVEGSPETGHALARVRYASVVLIELARAERPAFDEAIAALAGALVGVPVPSAVPKAATFRIRTSDGGRLVPVDPAARNALENAVQSWSGRRLDRRGGGIEVWVVRRTGERPVTLAVRIDEKHEPRPLAGSLKSDLAAALVRTVPACSSDVVLDPFAGSGAILRERARLPHRRLIATDIDERSASRLAAAQREGGLGARALTAPLDIRDLDRVIALVGGAAVDVVLTDPPWGLFETAPDLDNLYAAAFEAFAAVLRPGGRVVLLTAAAAATEAAIRTAGFGLAEAFPVLVNGRKAQVVIATPPT